jgi:ferredoxin
MGRRQGRGAGKRGRRGGRRGQEGRGRRGLGGSRRAAPPGGAPAPPRQQLAWPQGAPPSGKDASGSLPAQARAIPEQSEAIRTSPGRPGQARAQAALVAVVNPEYCVACGICEETCPVGAISVDQVARVDGARCTGCGQCVAECPRGALSLHEA